MAFASRAGEKLEHALKTFNVRVDGLVCADFGSSTGGFVDCLLQAGAQKVYAVETGYGVLDWKLRNDARVVVLERTNAMHAALPEKVDLVTIDTSWTRLDKVLPNALANLKPGRFVIALVKPHYEAEQKMLRNGTLPDAMIAGVLDTVREKLMKIPVEIVSETESPILGEKGKNREFLFFIRAIVKK